MISLPFVCVHFFFYFGGRFPTHSLVRLSSDYYYYSFAFLFFAVIHNIGVESEWFDALLYVNKRVDYFYWRYVSIFFGE